jgi:hypothetical protein
LLPSAEPAPITLERPIRPDAQATGAEIAPIVLDQE